MKEIDAFCVVDTRGWGSPKAIALSVGQCKLNYVSGLYGLPIATDHEKWWRDNAKKHLLRIVKVRVGTKERNIGKRWSEFRQTPDDKCCEVDNGGLNVKRCESPAKHELMGRKICTTHKKMLISGRELRWID